MLGTEAYLGMYDCLQPTTQPSLREVLPGSDHSEYCTIVP